MWIKLVYVQYIDTTGSIFSMSFFAMIQKYARGPEMNIYK